VNVAEIDEWPTDILLDGYEGWREYHDKPWHDEEATDKQLTALARRGWVAPDDITKGQANFALLRPSRKMLRILIRRGLWLPGDPPLTFGDAADLVGRIAKKEGWGCR
jgi:hypothetical protein